MPQDDPESEIRSLPHGTTPRSFQVLAEWLKENREALQTQIGGLAIRFEEIDRENKRRLDDIHTETKRTNGRVTDLEQSRKLAVALDTGHTAWQQEQHDEDEQRRVRREKRFDRLANFGYVALGLIGGGIGRLIGLY